MWNQARRQQEGSGSFQKPPEPELNRISTLSQPLPCAAETASQGLDHTLGSILWEKTVFFERPSQKEPGGLDQKTPLPLPLGHVKTAHR